MRGFKVFLIVISMVFVIASCGSSSSSTTTAAAVSIPSKVKVL
jgi:hypothetical protein